MRWRSAGTLVTLGLLAGCGSGRRPVMVEQPAPTEVVEVVNDYVSREERYTITSGDCRITWTVFKTAVNAGVVKHQAVCALGLDKQAPLIGKLLEQVGTFHTLMWGRLYPDDAREWTLPARLAVAAGRSESWDAVRGRPKSGEINAWTRKTMEEAKVYQELKSVFEAKGLDIRLAGVEKVLIQQAGKLKFFGDLSAAGVSVADNVPFDCQTWFTVSESGTRLH
ncbi:MAG: hypothetical protein ABI972_27330 [Acidobacteriota bacterium]